MPYLNTIGIERTYAGWVAGAIPVVSVLGRLGFGWFGDRFYKQRLTAIGVALTVVSLLMFGFVDQLGDWGLVVFVVLFSIGYGGPVPMIPSLLRERFGRTHLGAILGMSQGLAMIGSIAGQPLAGWIFDTQWQLCWRMADFRCCQSAWHDQFVDHNTERKTLRCPLRYDPPVPKRWRGFRKWPSTAIVMPPGIFAQEVIDAITPEMTLCAFIDGQVATSYAAWPYTMRFNGASVPVAAITFVGTRPVYRRRGCLRSVITRHFEQLYEQSQQAVAVLFASQAAIYQRYGYAVVSTRNSYVVAPRHLAFTRPFDMPDDGCLRDATDDGAAVFQAIYDRFVMDRTGYLERTLFMWNTGMLAQPLAGNVLQKIVYERKRATLRIPYLYCPAAYGQSRTTGTKADGTRFCLVDPERVIRTC